MLRVLTDLFDSLRSAPAAAGAAREHTLELATAVLMLEVVRADGRLDEAERRAVIEALRRRFALSEAELAGLFELAHTHSEEAHDLYSFTARLNQELDEAERVHVFELLWQVAHADGRADHHEEHLLRRLADLLHITRRDAILAKLRGARATAD